MFLKGGSTARRVACGSNPITSAANRLPACVFPLLQSVCFLVTFLFFFFFLKQIRIASVSLTLILHTGKRCEERPSSVRLKITLATRDPMTRLEEPKESYEHNAAALFRIQEQANNAQNIKVHALIFYVGSVHRT